MEREDRVIYTSHYNNITSVHLFFIFFLRKSWWCKKEKKCKHSITKDTLKKFKQIVQPFFVFFSLFWCRSLVSLERVHQKLGWILGFWGNGYPGMNCGCIFPEESTLTPTGPDFSLRRCLIINQCQKWHVIVAIEREVYVFFFHAHLQWRSLVLLFYPNT